MKKRIGILRGKPIIEGDINLKTGNEIHVKQLSGGSGESGEGASTIEYLDVSAVDFTNNHNSWLLYNSYLVAIKATYMGMNATFIAPTSNILSSIEELEDVSYKHVAIDINCETLNIIDGDKSILTIKDVAINRGWTQEQLDAIPRINKEEFYSL